MSGSEAPGEGRRARTLLGMGAAAGLAMAALSLLSAPPDGGRLPEGFVARNRRQWSTNSASPHRYYLWRSVHRELG